MSGLHNAELVISRARDLQELLSAKKLDHDDIYAAAKELASVASREDEQPAPQRFEPDPNRKQTDPSDEEAMASISLSMQTGAVLVAASTAVPEGSASKPGDTSTLQTAIEHLENTRNIVVEQKDARARFESAIKSVAASISPGEAPGEFRSRSDSLLTALTKDASHVVNDAFKALKTLDPSAILRGLQDFAQQSESLQSAGLLLKQGLAQIQRAYNALIGLLGKETLEKVKQKLQGIWDDVKNGKYTDSALDLTFGIRGVREKIESLFLSAGPSTPARIASIAPDLLIKACEDLAPLAPKFKKHMSLLSAMIPAITLAWAVLKFTPISAHAAPFVAGAYVLIVGAVIVIGREYAGAEWSLHWVRGVGLIVGGLLTPNAIGVMAQA